MNDWLKGDILNFTQHRAFRWYGYGGYPGTLP